jgi:mannobiose 2-epimerase
MRPALRGYASRLEMQLRTKTLPWWSQTLDIRYGGYLLSPDEKQLATQSRMVWVFSHAHRTGLGDYLDVAEKGVAFLLNRFRDPKHGGFFWKTDLSGRVRSNRKILYGQLFVLYALVEYFRASGDRSALDEARSLFELLVERAHDNTHGGWFEHFGRNWRPMRSHRRGLEVEVPGLKSANAHLHAVEAFTELYAQTADHEVETFLAEAVDLSKAHFYPDAPRASSSHRGRDWSPANRPGSLHGHNIEFAWLLVEAESALRREPSEDRFDAYVVHTLAASRPERLWWVEAEILAALTIGVVRWGRPRYEEALEELLGFLLAHVIDPVDGVWLHTVAVDGTPVNAVKVETWKDAYHEVRATAMLIDALAAPRNSS